MLETIRQVGREMLLETGEVEVLYRCHREWFVNWLTAGIHKQMNAELPEWMDQIDSDFDNLRLAIEWSYMEGSGRNMPCASARHLPLLVDRGNLAEGASGSNRD
jgi:predicted ATPase